MTIEIFLNTFTLLLIEFFQSQFFLVFGVLFFCSFLLLVMIKFIKYILYMGV